MKSSNLFTIALAMSAMIFAQQADAQITQTSTATLTHNTATGPDVFGLDGKEITMEITWAAGTTWNTFSNLQQAISTSTSITIDGTDVVFPSSSELPLILNIVNSVSDRLAYSDINENVIINFTYLGATSSTRSLIHPEAEPLDLASGTQLQACHLARLDFDGNIVNLLDNDGFFSELVVDAARYDYTNISNEIVGGSIILGDMNGDCVVNLLDIDGFIDALSTGTFVAEADTNQDGLVNLNDIQPFVDLL
jgi:hypothetical protein